MFTSGQSQPGDHDLQRADLQRVDSLGDQGLQLAGDDVQGHRSAWTRRCSTRCRFLFLFTIGGLTGLFLGTLATDVHLHDTYFVVAHFHYVMMGGTLIAFLGGLHYWWPKMFGRMYSETWGRIAAVLIFIGFNLTFFPQFVLGSKGMPRRYYNYPPEFTIYHQISTVGSYLLAVGLRADRGLPDRTRCSAGGRRRPTPGARRRWSGSAPRRRPTTTSTRRRPSMTPTTSAPCATMRTSTATCLPRAGKAARALGRSGRERMARRAQHLAHHFDSAKQQFESSKLGMWLFLATEILLFGGLFCAYAVYRANHPEIFVYAHHFLDKTLGGINTVVLICSSLTMAWAVRAAQLGPAAAHGDPARDHPALRLRLPRHQGRRVQAEVGARTALGQALPARPARCRRGRPCRAGPAGGAAQGGGRRQRRLADRPGGAGAERPRSRGAARTRFRGEHLPPADLAAPKNVQVFFAIYFAMTGLHGIHVLAGMIAIGWILRRAQRGEFGPEYYTPGRPGGPLLAPGGPDLDLPLPAALPHQMSGRREPGGWRR